MAQEPVNEDRRSQIKELLLVIAGCEEALRLSMAQEDYEFQQKLKATKSKYYEQLRRVMYGLPAETPTVETKSSS